MGIKKVIEKFYCDRIGDIEFSCVEQCAECFERESKSIGLGDLVDRITDVTGIKSVVRRIAPQGCGGCGHRKDVLNRIRIKK